MYSFEDTQEVYHLEQVLGKETDSKENGLVFPFMKILLKVTRLVESARCNRN
ncbi:MAG: hypothetical protein ACNS62_22310 [Candidatus Cyclobacteriaceae bacterium M3_2C_046]